jgi:hypothetical protein
MLKICATLFGLIMLAIGVSGFVPEINPNGHLMGIFNLNLVHNLIHVITGFISLACGLSSEIASRIFFQVFGILYALFALLGFYFVERPIFGIIAHNLPDAIFHSLIAIIALFLGFGYYTQKTLQKR